MLGLNLIYDSKRGPSEMIAEAHDRYMQTSFSHYCFSFIYSLVACHFFRTQANRDIVVKREIDNKNIL